MKYIEIEKGRFQQRPNRFIAYVELNGRSERVHVKNTGRCRELLTPGAAVYLEKGRNPGRSTAYDLIAVEKGERLVNMDSQAPNRAVEEWLRSGGLFPETTLIRPETVYGNSRFDFYVETAEEKIFIEVKGVTLEEEGVVRFPDAPSERAVKHVEELIAAKQSGYRVFVLFVVQMEGVKYFTPNRDTHPAFAEALCRAAEAGVEILAYDCAVTPDSMRLRSPVPVRLGVEPPEDEAASADDFRGKADPSLETPGFVGGGRENVPIRFRESLEDIKGTLRLAGIPKPLLEWYDRSRRILPWREEPSPYRVWVSEIMLQQTRVEAVKPYFKRFMEALPDIRALAEADEERLLKLWEGLGYYNRARNLQKAAVRIQEDYGGEMPSEYEELLKLPGIGSYTAGAISSIAYGKKHPAVDGNVLRVLSRIREDERPITDGKVKTAVEEELSEVMPSDRPGDFNQAMMEIGACVCLPNGAPLCGGCPLTSLCLACARGTQADFPKKEGKKERKILEKTILVIRDRDRTVIRRRAEKGLLAGMYEFPTLEGFRTAEEVASYLAGNGIRVLRILPLEDARHIFSHREWHMKGYMIRVDELESGEPGEDTRDWLYVEPAETEEKYPIPSAYAAYTRSLSIRLGKERYKEDL
ncbi:MAG: A/G-specific adenine glycosylase [Roseburia sp.]|nr:A/G-specific adenine glycosylase [Roseburia sp.]MCM1097029.1 A/G-specific adenine glycosylase [Ruminococcus flavefaciens]